MYRTGDILVKKVNIKGRRERDGRNCTAAGVGATYAGEEAQCQENLTLIISGFNLPNKEMITLYRIEDRRKNREGRILGKEKCIIERGNVIGGKNLK